MNSVFVPHIDANAAMELVRELRAKGLVQGHDFEFAYNHASYDLNSYEAVTPKGVRFKFNDPKWVTFFRLKYDGST